MGGAGDARTGPGGADGVPSRLELVVRAGCHLCETAREVVAEVAARVGVTWVERDVEADPEDARRYLDLVPVVLLDGEVHDYWRVDADRLEGALTRR